MKTNRHSRWYKTVGGDFGAVKLGGKWVWYNCLVCARYAHPEEFKTPRWQGPPSSAIIRASWPPRVPLPCNPNNHARALRALKEERP